MAFKKMDSKGKLPGPRAIFFSGFSRETEKTVMKFIDDYGLTNISIIPCRKDSLDKKLYEVLKDTSDEEYIEADQLPQVMLLSGLQFDEVDTFLHNFSETGIPRPIFATTTDANLDFTIKELLRHLLGEQKSLQEAMKKQ